MTVPPTVHADFFDDLRQWLILKMIELDWELSRDPSNPSDPADVQAVCIAFFAGLHRRIPSMPRRVEWSTELRAKKPRLSQETMLGLDTVEAEVLAGADLNARLNKWIKAPSDPRKQDMLLSDWNSYHLHLGPRAKAQDFVQRSGPVLFVRVTSDTIYFVDVMLHGRHAAASPWEQSSLMETVLRNWPHLLIKTTIRGGVPRTPEDLKEARAYGVQTLWQAADGTNYFPAGGGYSTARTSTKAVSDADHIISEVRRLDSVCRNVLALAVRALPGFDPRCQRR